MISNRALHWSTRTILLCGLLFTLRAEAQVEGERVVVVVEAPGGESVGVGERVRLELSKQSGAQIRSLAQETNEETPPRVILTVLGTKEGVVNVLYWDLTGRVDALSAPAVAGEKRFELVATTLASALLQRNLPRLAKAGPTRAAAACEWVDLVAELRIQAARAQPKHRTFPISIDDF